MSEDKVSNENSFIEYINEKVSLVLPTLKGEKRGIAISILEAAIKKITFDGWEQEL